MTVPKIKEPGCGSCEEYGCQECCPHDERDHGFCMDCDHFQEFVYEKPDYD